MKSWHRLLLRVAVGVALCAGIVGHARLDPGVLDRRTWDREIVVGENGEICELSGFDLTLLTDLSGKPTVGFGPKPQRGFAIELVCRWNPAAWAAQAGLGEPKLPLSGRTRA